MMLGGMVVGLAMLVACGAQPPTGEELSDAEGAFQQAFPRVTCGGPPGFDPSLLDRPGAAESGDDAIAAALRAALVPVQGESDALPETGWIEVTRTDEEIRFLAHGGSGPGLAIVTIQQRDGQWMPDREGRCDLRPAIRDGLDLATFRVAQPQMLAADTTEIDVLVMEMVCNSGQDAHGRVVEPMIVDGTDALIVVMATRPRGGGQDCQANPETPFVLELPAPLGDRLLLDGGQIPPRDATTCHPRVCP